MVLKSLLIFLVLFNANSAPETAKHGEKTLKDYFGPVAPNYEYNNYRSHFQYVDDLIVNDYARDKFGDEVLNLESFFNTELHNGLNCPDFAYLPKYEYIQYLNRLQVLSYLFQSLREHEYLSRKLNLKSSCKIDWKKFIKRCNPKTKEMKGFTRDSKLAFQSLEKVIVPFSGDREKFISNWIRNFERNNYKTLTHYRMNFLCSKKNCKDLKRKDLTEFINPICEDEKRIFIEVCSEEDSLMGVSYTPEIFHLIAESSGIRGINEDGYGAGCLKRFIEQNKDNEKKEFVLKDIFSVLYEYNKISSPTIPQGRLFSIGAVKEFTDKGLVSLFKPIPKSKKESRIIKKQVVALLNPEFEQIVLPKFVKKKKKKKKKVVKKVQKPQKKIEKRSTFLIAADFRRTFKLDKVDLDMDKFKYDYIFTLSQSKSMRDQIINFSSIDALKSMKKLDKLGSKNAPIPLKFVKFLIDKDLHQNLYNMVNTLSPRVYVFNDIDKAAKEFELIELKNDVSTNFKWKISILKP